MIKATQSLYIILLNLIFRATSLISNNTRDVCLRVLCFAFPVFFLIRDLNGFQHLLLTETAENIVGSIIITVLIIISVDRPMKHIRWRPLFYYPLVLTGIGIILISFLHTIGSGYRMFGLMIIFLYPCLYFVWNNRGDYERLFSYISYAFCWVGSLCYFYCLYLTINGDPAYFMDGRYAGPFIHPNLLCIFGMIEFCCSLFLIFRSGNGMLIHFLLSISLATGAGMVFMGQSRISLAVCIATAFVSILFYLLHCKGKKALRVILKSLVTLFVILIVLFISQINVDEQNKIFNNINTPTTEQPAVEGSDFMSRISGDNTNNADGYTSGRIGIWKNISEKINLTGNDYRSTDWNQLTNGLAVNAHNNFFEMTYRFGIVIGSLSILLELVAGIQAIIYLFKNKDNRYYMLFPVIFMVVYLFESMLDIATMPFERIAPLMFFFAIAPMFEKKETK